MKNAQLIDVKGIKPLKSEIDLQVFDKITAYFLQIFNRNEGRCCINPKLPQNGGMEKQKRRYKITNWSAYNEALVNRGSLTLWIDDSQIECWHKAERSGYRGSPMTYSDVAIQCSLMIREVFKLALRATEGFLRSLVKWLGVPLPLQVPDYSTLCRRQKTLSVELPRTSGQTPRHLVVDSTGLKVYGEGEWKVRQHGAGKRRTWRKFHLAVDAQTQEVVAAELTANFVGDAEVLPVQNKVSLSGNERAVIIVAA